MAQLISHIEIPVSDIDKAKEFYSNLFGWDFKPFGNGYLLFNNRKGITAGLRKSENISTGESTIFHVNVNNIDEILQRVPGLGGKVERNKITIPVMGWYALLKDPDGNTVGLFQGH